MKRCFHFTLGPVQGFVAQARRTRDFWAGSFILSWLSAVAMREVLAQQGQSLQNDTDPECIRFPKPDPIFLAWLDGREQGNRGPAQANVPNRFTAVLKRGGDFYPREVEQAVRKAWRGLAGKVWNEDLATIAGEHSKRIWDRQVDGFWEISWALVTDDTATDVLDRRKNWRSHLPPPEPGIKCMVMDGWQELSGAESPIKREKVKLDDFWKQVRERDDAMRRDLRREEHLCAMAFIKRRFPRHFDKVKVSMEGWTAHGWQVPTTVPSVVYLAAVPWLAEVIGVAGDDALKQFHDHASDLTRIDKEWTPHDERPTDIRRIKQAVAARGGGDLDNFRALEGGMFFESYLEDSKRWEDTERKQVQRVLRRLHDLQSKTGKGSASPFYAVLLMDGDEIGKHMSSSEKQPAITEGLAQFTRRLPDLVYAHDGFLVYAGGDDVLALLPIDTALSCACALSETFRLTFEDAFAACETPENDRFSATLSGAIELAHIKTPLTRILQDAHDLLDRIAKDGRGRDAIACRVWKPGHLALEWAMPWEKAITNGRIVISDLADDFAARDELNPSFAGRFFYRIRERLELLQPAKSGASELSTEQAAKLMTAEYLASGVNDNCRPEDRIDVDEAGKQVKRLLMQCEGWRRFPIAGGGFECRSEGRWEADGALLARFLAQKGVER